MHLQIARSLIPIARATLDLADRLPGVEGVPHIAPKLVLGLGAHGAFLRLRLVERVVDEPQPQERAPALLAETDLLVRPRAEPARVLGEIQMVERPPSLGKLHEVGFASGLPTGLFFRRFSRKSFPLLSDGRGIAPQAAGAPEEFYGPSLKRGPAVLLAPNHAIPPASPAACPRLPPCPQAWQAPARSQRLQDPPSTRALRESSPWSTAPTLRHPTRKIGRASCR